MKPSSRPENKTPSGTYCRVKLVCEKVQAHSSLEPPLIQNNKLWQVKKKMYPDIFSYHWISMDTQKLSPMFLEQGL